MSGTVAGGLKASKTNRKLYGDNYYAEMGRKGGMSGHTGGFAANKELARKAGAKGGRSSRRAGGIQSKLDEVFKNYIELEFEKGSSIHYIAKRIGVSDQTIKRFAIRHKLIGGDYTPIKNYWQNKDDSQK